MVAIAVIPARIGSKRLPRKNIIDFAGRPIIAYTIDAAHRSGLFDAVVVSTDSDEIAAVAADCGARIIERPAALGADTAVVVDVCLHALDAESAHGREYDRMACLYATAPLRTAEDVAATMSLLDLPADFAMAVSAYDAHPLQAIRIQRDESGALSNRGRPLFPELQHGRIRAYRDLYVSNGSTYAVRTDAFRRLRTFYGPNAAYHIMPRARGIDINMSEDLDLALFYHDKAGSPGTLA